MELENSNDPPVILSGKMTLSLIPDPLAHEGHTGRDSGQESEQEDGHDSNGLEQKGEYGCDIKSPQKGLYNVLKTIFYLEIGLVHLFCQISYKKVLVLFPL